MESLSRNKIIHAFRRNYFYRFIKWCVIIIINLIILQIPDLEHYNVLDVGKNLVNIWTKSLP